MKVILMDRQKAFKIFLLCKEEVKGNKEEEESNKPPREKCLNRMRFRFEDDDAKNR